MGAAQQMTPNAASSLPRPLPQDLPRTDLVPPPQDLAGAVAAAGPAPVLQQPSSQPQDDPGRWSRKPSKKLASPPEVSPAGLSAASGSKDITVTSEGHQGIGEEDDDLFDFQWPEGVPRTALHPRGMSASAGLSTSCGFGAGSRGCGDDLFTELKQELQHPLNAGFATPTQSTDLSFLSQMRQKLLLSQDMHGLEEGLQLTDVSRRVSPGAAE